ncbi:hypothetical protein [Staphylococcus lugdunensis]|uniref:hypothetical protein n=1 Tax=Staphylococcus lugdunensis TaxID=28035 RepID=UPI0015624A3B|nr:hypothetical protein [Staphylococcus lugdunensis]MDU0994897.1 hypothetical protein [Staphylococcus lugdunensis]
MGPQHRGFQNESQRTTRVGVGPQQKEMQQAFPRTKQVGVAPTWRSSVRNPTSKTS